MCPLWGYPGVGGCSGKVFLTAQPLCAQLPYDLPSAFPCTLVSDLRWKGSRFQALQQINILESPEALESGYPWGLCLLLRWERDSGKHHPHSLRKPLPFFLPSPPISQALRKPEMEVRPSWTGKKLGSGSVGDGAIVVRGRTRQAKPGPQSLAALKPQNSGVRRQVRAV